MSEKDEDDNSVRFQYLVNEMSKKLKAEKYGRKSLTYQVSNSELDIFADLKPAEERAVIGAARQKIELEQKEQEKEREQKEIDKHRALRAKREDLPRLLTCVVLECAFRCSTDPQKDMHPLPEENTPRRRRRKLARQPSRSLSIFIRESKQSNH